MVLTAPQRVWCLTVALAALAVGSWSVLDLGRTVDGSLSWWWIALGYAAVEILVVHVHLRQEAYSFSLAELLLVVGLVHASPAALIVGQVVGTAITLLAVRRQPVLKVAFNVANAAVTTTAALFLFHVIMSGRDPLDPTGWLAVFGATLGSAVVNVTLIGVAMTLAGGRFDSAKMVQAGAFGLVVAASNAALGLSCVLVIRAEPVAVILLAVPAATLLVAYRAYAAERRHHESLEFLYQSTRALAEHRELGAAVTTLLDNACVAFRSSVGELILLPTDDATGAARTRVAAGAESIVMEPVPYRSDDPVWQLLLRTTEPMFVDRRTADPALAEYLKGLGAETAMVTKLEGEHRAVGLMTIGGRVRDITPFSRTDLRLFETVAGHAALSLENDQLETSVTKLLELERQLSRQAFHDPLTGLANRSRFRRHLDEVVGDSRRATSVVMVIDLDDFKSVNDTLGHGAGDEVLRVVGERLVETLRVDDVTARLGGDEFAILLDPDGRDADAVATRVVDAVCKAIRLADREVHVGCSIGSVVVGDAETTDELIRRADLAMYEAKSRGKGLHQRYTPELSANLDARRTLRSNLDAALEREEFEVHFQPVIELATGATVGAEALVRWRSSDGALRPAGEFIQFAEETGQSLAIGSFVIERAVLKAAALVGRCGPRFTVAVNISGRQLSHDATVSDLRRALEIAQLEPDNLVIEITEEAVGIDPAANLERVRELAALGVRLAYDDFGAGHASLQHLRELPIDVLKLARSLGDDLTVSPEQSRFLRGLIDLGHCLGMTVVGQGVETTEQAQILAVLGCDLAQGFLYDHALPIEDFVDRYAPDGLVEQSSS